MKKREIIKQANILYKEGKTRQEVYEFLIKKIEKPISYTANILRFCPPMNTRKKLAPFYNKEQTIYTTQKGQKRKKLVIKFND